MKNKKKILSLIACLSLLSSCNKNSPSSSLSSNATTSTVSSTVTPTPSKTVEELNKELFENYAIFTNTSDGSLRLDGFKNEIPNELLNLETIIIPEAINEKALTELYNASNGLFNIFQNTKTIKISSNVKYIYYSTNTSNTLSSSPFVNLPNLENIEVDSNNQLYYSKGNCLIKKENNIIICGWKDVEIPEEVTTLRGLAFSNNQSITTIKLNSQLDNVYYESSSSSKYYNSYTSFKNLDNLISIDIGDNTKFRTSGNVLYNLNNNIIAAWGDVTLSEEANIKVINLRDFTSITSVIISNSVDTITSYAFANTKIKTLIIPENVMYISGDSLQEMKYLESITSNSSKFSTDLGKNCLINT